MTTPDGTTDATANPTPAEATANQVVIDAAAAVDVENAPEELTLEGVKDLITSQVGSLQGAIANRSGQDRKVLGDRLERIENAVTVMSSTADEQARNAKLATMTAEEQAEFLYEENKTLRATPAPNTAQQQVNESQWLNQNDTTELAAFTDGALAAAGIQTPRNDQRLWAGAQQGMTLDQLKVVAQGNIRAFAQPAASQPGTLGTPSVPAEPTTTPPAVPPSMQDAPVATIADFSSRAEMAQAALRGEIDSNQIAEIMVNKGWR
jgi:hypothetical protein